MTKVRLPLLALGSLLLATTVARAGTPNVSETAGAAKAPATEATLAHAGRQLARRHAELDRLQRAVAEQESRSQQATARGEQQDRAIAELQRQLRAAQAGAPQTGSPPPGSTPAGGRR